MPFRAMDVVEVVRYQLDRFRFRVGHCQSHGDLSELKPEPSGVAKVK